MRTPQASSTALAMAAAVGMLAVSPIAAVVTYVLMGLVFFGVLWPIALLTNAKQRDALKLKFDKNATTYWEDKPQVTDPRRYFRQY